MSLARKALNQRKLDISAKSRANMLAWRGQFSPELVEYLLLELCNNHEVILDPFCGSGTVLSESLRLGKNAVGIDINPAAFVLSTLTDFFEPSIVKRATLIGEAEKFVAQQGSRLAADDPAAIRKIVELAPAACLRQFLHIAALVGCGDSLDFSASRLTSGVRKISRLLKVFPQTSGKSLHICADARDGIFSTPHFDAVLTSPPYINVFNYHQNYRPVLEHLGWTPLQSASAEIGANRKFRQNRFLTVVQYCLDMAVLLNAIRRRLSSSGLAIFVIGRESNVLRTAFRNGEIFSTLAQTDGAFNLELQCERTFINRFGVRIIEDILVFRPGRLVDIPLISAGAHGTAFLSEALRRVPNAAALTLEEALDASPRVRPSAKIIPRMSPLWPSYMHRDLKVA